MIYHCLSSPGIIRDTDVTVKLHVYRYELKEVLMMEVTRESPHVLLASVNSSTCVVLIEQSVKIR